jgi:NADH:ubiquinone oxidoreductase subunit 6 (subunit J)
MGMTKFEKRLSLIAIVFVVIYLGAAAVTIHNRISNVAKTLRIESTGPPPGESHMMIAELFLPMMIVLVLAVCFVFVKKQRVKQIKALEQEVDGDHRSAQLESTLTPPQERNGLDASR